MAIDLIVPKEFPYALMGLCANFLLCQLLAPMFVLPARKQVFTREHLSQFDGVHKENFPTSNIDALGNPDQGNGWYGKTLPFDKWVVIASAQRIIMNYIESFPYLITFTICSCFYFPTYSVIGVWLVLVGRVFYAFGYKKEPKARIYGALIMAIGNMMMMVLSFVSAFYLMGAK